MYFTKHLIYVLVAAFLATNTMAAECDEAAPQILVLGDSLSAAYNMETGAAWPSLLEARLKEDGYDWRVFNSSITGDTTQGGVSRLPRLLERYAPGIVILELGGNDGLRGLPPGVTRENLAAMIEMSQKAGARVLLAGIRIPPNYGTQYVERFERIYPELSEQYGTALVPFFMDGVALDPLMMQDDGVHPSVEAQPLLLDNLWPVLQPLLESGSEDQAR